MDQWSFVIIRSKLFPLACQKQWNVWYRAKYLTCPTWMIYQNLLAGMALFNLLLLFTFSEPFIVSDLDSSRTVKLKMILWVKWHCLKIWLVEVLKLVPNLLCASSSWDPESEWSCWRLRKDLLKAKCCTISTFRRPKKRKSWSNCGETNNGNSDKIFRFYIILSQVRFFY